MKTNIGTTDKALRISLGLLLILIAMLFTLSVTLKAILVVVGAVTILTSVIGFCLMYRIAGIDTCKLKIDR